MGNSSTSFIDSYVGNPFFSSGSSSDQCAKLLSQFKLISTYEDDLFMRCSVLEHKQTNQLIIAKEIDCQSQVQMNRLHKQFENRRTTLIDQNLIRLRYVLKKKTDGIFSDEFKIVLFFDYVLASLTEELNNRTKNKIMFSPEEINSILCGAIRGYAFLEQLNLINDKIRIKNIYFGLKEKDPCIKITDSKLFPTSSNLDIVRNRQRQIVFLSPEQLKFLSKPQTFGKIQQGRKFTKAGVFCLGMIIIELCLTLPSYQMYDYRTLNLNYLELQTRLNIIKNKYPLSIFYILRQMTERNDDSRPSFIKLRDSLPTNLKNQQQRMTLSIINPSNDRQINTLASKMTKVLPPTGYTKLINPTTIHPNQRKMNTTTLASQYRPNVDASQVYTNGNMYTGQKKDNLRHGKGKYLYNDGSYYYGDWFKGKMEGFGQIYNTDGQLIYEGQWKDDHYHGKGKLIGENVDWSKYQGDFVNGKMEGFGQIIFKDGNRYKGQFRADFPWGKGRMIMRDGQVQAGIWQRGNFIKQL